jgi:aryl-alcohol dehydrogenase-like predicted oxidoreductase
VLDDDDVAAELERLRAEGLAVGLTVTGSRQAETIERAVELSRFDTVQATWNLLERSAGPALARAHGEGVGVLVKEALANGRLTDRGDVERVREHARRLGVPSDALALAAVLAQPWADVVLSGAATAEQSDSNLGALELSHDGSLDDLAEDRDAYWARRSALPWN